MTPNKILKLFNYKYFIKIALILTFHFKNSIFIMTH